MKDEVLSILRDQIENGKKPGDLYGEIMAKFGVSKETIRRWNLDLKKKMISVSSAGGFSSREIFQIVLQASVLNELEQGQFLRSRGVTKEQLDGWRDTYEQAYSQKVVRSNQPDREAQKKIKKLEGELRRKEKALAETAAILVLRGKADAFLGKTRSVDLVFRSHNSNRVD